MQQQNMHGQGGQQQHMYGMQQGGMQGHQGMNPAHHGRGGFGNAGGMPPPMQHHQGMSAHGSSPAMHNGGMNQFPTRQPQMPSKPIEYHTLDDSDDDSPEKSPERPPVNESSHQDHSRSPIVYSKTQDSTNKVSFSGGPHPEQVERRSRSPNQSTDISPSRDATNHTQDSSVSNSIRENPAELQSTKESNPIKENPAGLEKTNTSNPTRENPAGLQNMKAPNPIRENPAAGLQNMKAASNSSGMPPPPVSSKLYGVISSSRFVRKTVTCLEDAAVYRQSRVIIR